MCLWGTGSPSGILSLPPLPPSLVNKFSGSRHDTGGLVAGLHAFWGADGAPVSRGVFRPGAARCPLVDLIPRPRGRRRAGATHRCVHACRDTASCRVRALLRPFHLIPATSLLVFIHVVLRTQGAKMRRDINYNMIWYR